MATTVDLLTAEEFTRLPDDGKSKELVRGHVIEMLPPTPRHGKICFRIGGFLFQFLEKHDVGHVMCNDSAVITARKPDSVRGADLCYYSYGRLPKGRVPGGYLDVVPDLVVEVLSPDDRWSKVHEKTAEYLHAGVTVVCIVDPETESVHLHYADLAPQVLKSHDDLIFPELLPDFRVPVAKLFD